MIDWSGLESKTKSWFEDLSEKTEDDTAKFLADSYAQAVSEAVDPMANAVVPPKKEAGIEQAWSLAFKTQKASPTKLGSVNWVPVETKILLYWTAAIFSQAIPHPPTVVPVTNLVTVPGTPGIAPAIDKAFKQEEAGKVAKELVTGYKNHAKTIAGVYTGITPPAASVTVPVPWVGIK